MEMAHLPPASRQIAPRMFFTNTNPIKRQPAIIIRHWRAPGTTKTTGRFTLKNKIIACPGCGADVAYTDGASMVTCPYCGTQIAVSNREYMQSLLMRNAMLQTNMAIHNNMQSPVYASWQYRTPCDELDLRPAMRQALAAGGFRTVGDFVGKTRWQVQAACNLGPSQMQILRSALESYGVTLGTGKDYANHPSARQVPQNYGRPFEEMHINELGLSNMAYTLLVRENLVFVQQVVCYTPTELLALDFIDMYVRELETALQQYGLHLAPEPT